MEETDLLGILARGEDSLHQFKRDVTNSDSLAEEFVAFSNAKGGFLFIGVADDGTITGLSKEDVHRLNQLISNTASQNMNPPCNPMTRILEVEGKRVILVEIEEGIRKPYATKGVIVVKNGADKRRVTAVEEMQRMFQASRLVQGDEIPVKGTTVSDIDSDYFEAYVSKEFGDAAMQTDTAQLLENMNLMRDGLLTTAAVILFAKKPMTLLPAFLVKAVAFPGTTITDQNYIDSRDISGKIGDIFPLALSFCLNHAPVHQNGQSVNSVGEPVIPRIVFEELIVNALLHRDYLISAPIRLLAFQGRIEIISPGHLPNTLTVENIKNGNSNMRNPVLASFATKILPYRGIGSGIRRAYSAYPNIDLIDDKDGNLFSVVIRLPVSSATENECE